MLSDPCVSIVMLLSLDCPDASLTMYILPALTPEASGKVMVLVAVVSTIRYTNVSELPMVTFPFTGNVSNVEALEGVVTIEPPVVI